jgi:LysR family transcriptional regulator, repressor for citA
MNIKWLRTFIAAAEYENFRKTSEALFLTQPAVTKHIKRLEEYLGCDLFNREGKNVSLTAAGIKFLTHAKEIVRKYDIGMGDFESWKQGYNRKLTIAAAPQIASSFLPALLRDFIDKHPNIEVIINVLASYDIGEEVSVSKADIGLSRISPIQSNIKYEVIHEDPVILVGPNEPGVNLIDEEEAYLQKYRLITHNHPDYWEELLNDVRRHYPHVQTMAVNQIEVTKRFIEAGLGVSYLPFTMVRDEINKKGLAAVKSDKIKPENSLTYVLSKVETEEVRVFVQFLKEVVSTL